MSEITSTPAGIRRIFKTEEWQPVLAGLLIITAVIAGARLQIPSFKWIGAPSFASGLTAAAPGLERLSRDAAAAGETALSGAVESLRAAAESKDRGAVGAAGQALMDAAKSAKNAALAADAAALGKKLRDDARAGFLDVLSPSNLVNAAVIGGVLLIIALGAALLMGANAGLFLLGFPVVYALSWAAQLIAGNAAVTYWGIEYVVFALAIGLFISNVIGVPAWLREAARTELYIKIGLVILGAGILFPEILQAGMIGIIQAVLVVTVVWYACFWISRKMKIDDEFSAMLSSAVSICGVSAAIAACGAIQGDKKKLSYVISLTLIVAVPMMIAMPWIARLLKLPEAVAGAWMGGTLDTTGSVVAAGSLVGETAMRIGSIVKFSQNVFIVVAAFLLSLWWAFRSKGKGPGAEVKRPGMKVIWDRFPKFVLGFMAVSLVFSFILSPSFVKETKGMLTGLRTAWFSLAFVSIGLETKFSNLVSLGKGRPALAFAAAELFNVVWTLLLAFLLFGGGLFPAPA